MGVIMRKATHKQFVQNHLDMMFATVKHSSQAERDVSAHWVWGPVVTMEHYLYRAVQQELAMLPRRILTQF